MPWHCRWIDSVGILSRSNTRTEYKLVLLSYFLATGTGKRLVGNIIDQFSWLDGRITTYLPVEPGNDLFEKLSDGQCKTLKEKLENLKSVLENAEAEPDPHEASKMLNKELGDDFPIVEKDKSAQKRALAFPGKSESA